jgi:hypothetical protein
VLVVVVVLAFQLLVLVALVAVEMLITADLQMPNLVLQTLVAVEVLFVSLAHTQVVQAVLV